MSKTSDDTFHSYPNSDLPMNGGYRAKVVLPLDPPVTYAKARIFREGEPEAVANINFCVLQPRSEDEWMDIHFSEDFEDDYCILNIRTLFEDRYDKAFKHFQNTALIWKVDFRASAGLSGKQQAELVKAFTDALPTLVDVSMVYLECENEEEVILHEDCGGCCLCTVTWTVMHTSLTPAELRKRGKEGRMFAKDISANLKTA